jgi:DNA-binding NarL/FixJ family response regulator
MSATVTILIADDHPLFRGALKQGLQSDDISFSSNMLESEDLDSLLGMLDQNEDIDLVLLDLGMPGASGFSGLITIRAQYPDVPVIIVSAKDDPTTIRRAIELGASGYIPKSTRIEEMREAIQKVIAGDIWVPDDLDLGDEADPEVLDLIERMSSLTPQQLRVLAKLGQGLLNKQIAYELSVSEATVKAHVSAVLQKLNVDSRTQAVIKMSKINAEFMEDGEGGAETMSSVH